MSPDLYKDNKLKRDVRSKLYTIAKDYCLEYGIKRSDVHDIILTGSMAGYEYTDQSDIDLHIIVDFGKLGCDSQTIKDYHAVAKTLWNQKHNIEFNRHKIEIYVQDMSERHVAPGAYSILDDKWIELPKHVNTELDGKASEILNRLKKRVDKLQNIYSAGRNVTNRAQSLMSMIKSRRKHSLNNYGLSGRFNLVFKQLRNDGYVDRLNDLIIGSYDRNLSESASLHQVYKVLDQKVASKLAVKLHSVPVDEANKLLNTVDLAVRGRSKLDKKYLESLVDAAVDCGFSRNQAMDAYEAGRVASSSNVDETKPQSSVANPAAGYYAIQKLKNDMQQASYRDILNADSRTVLVFMNTFLKHLIS